MCGIAGIIHHSSSSAKDILDEMLARIVHRGPDDSGVFIDDKVAFGMRRLSIIDTAGGKQPISSEDGALVIVFNGEIYNFKKLRDELLASGHIFKTHSDTEVILHLYEEKGEDIVRELRGMFTFFIYDIKKGKAFIARDQFGIKPLYYWAEDGVVRAIGSEIKSLIAVPEYKKEINEEAVFHYLSYQYNPMRETFFRGIFRLPPATCITIDLKTGKMDEKKYWQFNFDDNEQMDEEAGAMALSKTMLDSVEHHLVSDVPVGAFLSGGVDSAFIVGAIRAVHPKGELKTFTIGAKDTNEFLEAREVAEFLKTSHTEIVLNPNEYFNELPRIAYHFDEPVADPSAVALYFLAREASKHVKVVLSGEGADELFGGYNIYREPFSLAKLDSVPALLRAPLFLLLKLPIEMRGMNYLRRYQKRLEDRYIGNAKVFSPEEAESIWKSKKYERMNLVKLYEEASQCSDSEKMQYIDIHTWLTGDILAKADKMTMAHSLELRVPFLDKKVADFSRTIPDRLKFKDGATKYLLRKASKAFVPAQTQVRKKLGFPVPLAGWLRERSDWQEKLLSHPFITSRFSIEIIKKLIDDHKEGRKDNARKIFVFLMLTAWYDAYFKEVW
ncbi:MAG: asparagine synthase (glutamine-hydrolyzing) [Candidatus Yonathbacteria bacterium]|nr:asparagine synthase (glutamine-hydrolyzing) [Candidatus Yonathbacteria bacterium]